MQITLEPSLDRTTIRLQTELENAMRLEFYLDENAAFVGENRKLFQNVGQCYFN
jgi:hypothetical protein